MSILPGHWEMMRPTGPSISGPSYRPMLMLCMSWVARPVTRRHRGRFRCGPVGPLGVLMFAKMGWGHDVS